MVDRQPTRPRRVLITPENGNTPFYGTIDMADEPYEGFEGTEWSKINVLPDNIAELIGLDPEANPLPKDAFALLDSKANMTSGTWTPMLIDDGAGTANTTAQINYYYITGNLMWIHSSIAVNGHNLSGTVYISGMPVMHAIPENGHYGRVYTRGINYGANAMDVVGLILIDGRVRLDVFRSDGSYFSVGGSQISATASIEINAVIPVIPQIPS